MALIAAAFTMPITMPTSRVFVALALVCVVVKYVRARQWPRIPASAWMVVVFFAAAVISTAHGTNPHLGFSKIDKILWFLAIPVTALSIGSYRQLTSVLGAFAVGAGVEAVKLIVDPLVRAGAALVSGEETGFWRSVGTLWSATQADWQASAELVRTGWRPGYLDWLTDFGSMADAQRLMIGILVALGFVLIRRIEGHSYRRWAFLIVIQAVALVLTFKRGSWICTAGCIVLLLSLRTSWRHVVAIAVGVVAIAMLPPVRGRLMDLRHEAVLDKGGRLFMWTRIAPVLIKERPWLGVGYRCVTMKTMKNVSRTVEGGRTHLHSNPVEVIVELGLVGLLVYVAWMLIGLRDAATFAWRTRAGPAAQSVLALVLFVCLSALLVNGLVEYNFGDAEIILMYGLILGAAAAGVARLAPRARGGARHASGPL